MNRTAKVVRLVPETLGGRHHCLFSENGATREQCFELSSLATNNRQCEEHLCTSLWRICPACIRLGVKNKSHILSAEVGLCQWHVDNGEDSMPGTPETEATRRKTTRAIIRPKTATKVAPKKPAGKDVQKQSPATSAGGPLGISDVMTQKDVSGKMAELKKRLSRALKTAGPAIDAPVHRIRRSEGQPREYFSEEDLIAVGMSIKEGAQVIAIYVRKISGDPNHDYEIIDGERRWRGCKKVNHPTIQVIVLDVDERTQYLISVIANFGREPNTDLEAARALQKIINNEGLSVPEAATLFSQPAHWAYNRLRLLKLDLSVQELLSPELPRERQLSFTIACTLAGYPDRGFQRRMAADIIKRSLGLNKAKVYIKEQAERLGKRSERQHEWRPGREYEALQRFISGMFDRAEHFLRLSDDVFRTTLRSSSTVRTDVGNLKKALLRAERLVKRMEDTQPR